ncbi:hypothetical protein CLG85_003900, partial [Yangia mangrovi]|nr:hypothetical protein [Alloyangia mangrovi]
MARGFLAGAIWGLVVSGVGAGVLSVAMGPPANRPTRPEMPIATDPVAEAVDSLGERAAPVSRAPEAEAPESAVETAETQEPAAVPEPPDRSFEAGNSEQKAAAPETPAERPSVETAPDAISEDAETPPPAHRPAGEQGVAPSAAGTGGY